MTAAAAQSQQLIRFHRRRPLAEYGGFPSIMRFHGAASNSCSPVRHPQFRYNHGMEFTVLHAEMERNELRCMPPRPSALIPLCLTFYPLPLHVRPMPLAAK
jgi:hypothetical protein